jgi:hypothetical protein
VGLPHRSVREAIALAIHVIAHIARIDGLRRVTEIVNVRGYDAESDRFLLEPTIVRQYPLEGAAP